MTIQLVPFHSAHYEHVIKEISDASFLMQWGGPMFHYPLTAKQLESYKATGDEPDASVRIYTAISETNDLPVGHIALGGIDLENYSARIGKVLIAEKNRGMGFGHRMVNEMLTMGFHELCLHRISLGVFDFNIPAIKTYENTGFQKDGLLRDVRRVGDAYWSLWEMSILEEEWRNLQKQK